MTKPARNDLCSCGSGKKFKKCCALKTWASKFSVLTGTMSKMSRIVPSPLKHESEGDKEKK